MNDKSVKALAEMMATATILTPEFNTYACVPQRKTKERTIRKCANPEKKLKGKLNRQVREGGKIKWLI